MANETLAQLSNNLMYSAIAVYLLAFLAYCAEWAFGSRSRVAVQSAALVKQRQPAEETSLAGERTGSRSKVSAGVGGSGGGVGISERPDPVAAARAEAARPTIGDSEEGDVSGGSERADRMGRIAISLTVLAFLLHFGSVLTRGLSVHRAPWGNMYEFSTAVSLVVVASFLVLLGRGKGHWLGVFVSLAVLTTLGVAVSALYTESAQLVPALHSYWLWIHVTAATVSFAALHLGCISAILYLCKDSYERRLASGRSGGRLTGFWQRLPTAAALDKTAYRVNAFIFPLWTFAIICGAIWAEGAWGRYWGWDPKETWAFITWVAYAAYLHARSTAGWKGRKAAYISLVAFACFVFNYYLVNIFFSGLHSYGGV